MTTTNKLFVHALCILSIGMSAACTEDPSYEIDMGDKSDDLAGREYNIVANDGITIEAGEHQAQIALIEREDKSVTIYPDSFVLDVAFTDMAITQPKPWISLNTTLYGFILAYRNRDSEDEWNPVSANGSLDNFTIFENAEVKWVGNGYQVSGKGINFNDIAFEENSTNPQGRLNEFDAVSPTLPQTFEMRIIPIPVWNFGTFEDSYTMDFVVSAL